MTSFYNLLKYAATGQASPSMTYFDKMRASTLMGGVVQTLTGQPPLSFKSDGTPLISWSMKGNGSQSGTPTPDAPIQPTFCGVRTGNLLDATMYGHIAPSVVYLSMLVAIPIVTLTSPEGLCTRVVWTKSTNATKRVHVSNWIAPENSSTFDLALYSDADCFKIEFRNVAYSDLTDEDIARRFNIMLNSGSTALPYEPFGWAEKITCASQTTPLYLGEVSTTRRIKKLVLTGEETSWDEGSTSLFLLNLPDVMNGSGITSCMCSHYNAVPNIEGGYSSLSDGCCSVRYNQQKIWFRDRSAGGLENFKSYLAHQYAAGTPVTVWYVLATPESAIINEPLAKIGDYADELSSTDAGVTIPTAKGQNTLTVDTDLQPSEVSITGNIKPTT